jgi:hypothetical protein
MFACLVLTIYVIGWITAIMVIRVRAGVGVWRRLKVFGDDGFGPGWTMSAGSAALFWPITLVIWLARGCPEPRIVFNEKALERRRRMNGS